MQALLFRNVSPCTPGPFLYFSFAPVLARNHKYWSKVVNSRRATPGSISPSRKPFTRPALRLSQVKDSEAKNRAFIFRSSSTDPYLNLSLEHYLLQNAHPESKILFLYANRPCVVIGRNQNPWVECALQKLHREPLSLNGKAGTVDGSEDGGGTQEVLLVRRRSGGGAVFHDEGNLNYSVIVPSHAKAEFKRVTHAKMVVRAVREVQKDLYPGTRVVEKTNVRLNDRHDIVMDRPGRGVLKVSGSAFKLTKGRALHHGTLLFLSPNLEEISGLLRSPARDFISARGVESVRSPVSNLFNMSQDVRHANLLRESLERSIVDEFRKMYGEEANPREVKVPTGEGFVAVREGSEDIGSEVDQSNGLSVEIMKGVREIMSSEWNFEQTPGFVVSNKPIEGEKGFSPPTSGSGLSAGTDVLVRVKNGIMQEVEISVSNEEGAAAREKQQIKSRLQGRKLHEMSDWKATFDGLDAWTHPETARLVEWLARMFPPLSKASVGQSEPVLTPEKSDDETHESHVFKRQRADGILEVETEGERVVEEVQSHGGSVMAQSQP